MPLVPGPGSGVHPLDTRIDTFIEADLAPPPPPPGTSTLLQQQQPSYAHSLHKHSRQSSDLQAQAGTPPSPLLSSCAAATLNTTRRIRRLCNTCYLLLYSSQGFSWRGGTGLPVPIPRALVTDSLVPSLVLSVQVIVEGQGHDECVWTIVFETIQEYFLW